MHYFFGNYHGCTTSSVLVMVILQDCKITTLRGQTGLRHIVRLCVYDIIWIRGVCGVCGVCGGTYAKGCMYYYYTVNM